MPTAHDSLLARITVDPEVRFGKPCIRGHRITVQDVSVARWRGIAGADLE